MQIITLTEKEFDDFAKKNEYTSYYQSSHYANLEKQLDRYNIHYLGFENDGVLVGAALMLYKETILGYKFAYSPRGFLIDYAEKTNKNAGKMAMKLVTMASETVIEEYEDSYDDYDELALLMEESKNMESQLKLLKSSANEISNFQSHLVNNLVHETPTPGETPTPTPDGATPTPNGEDDAEKGKVAHL